MDENVAVLIDISPCRYTKVDMCMLVSSPIYLVVIPQKPSQPGLIWVVLAGVSRRSDEEGGVEGELWVWTGPADPWRLTPGRGRRWGLCHPPVCEAGIKPSSTRPLPCKIDLLSGNLPSDWGIPAPPPPISSPLQRIFCDDHNHGYTILYPRFKCFCIKPKKWMENNKFFNHNRKVNENTFPVYSREVNIFYYAVKMKLQC